MSERRETFVRALVALSACAFVLAGCRQPSVGLELVSYKDPYSPETYVLALDECAYYVDPGGDYHLLGRASEDDGDGDSADHLLHVHLFWKPRPGKTFDNETSIDATIRYAIVTSNGASVYAGTGFVYPKKRRMGDQITAEIEVARLRLVSQTGDVPEILGDSRVSGTLAAENNAGLAIDLLREIDVRSSR